MPQVRLYLSNVRPDDPGYGLMGGADAGCAIDERNLALAKELAAAMRTAGYRNAFLVLEGDEPYDGDGV